MNNTPLVSVLIITYNQEATIARAIESVLEQEGEVPYEIIIGDDASTDGTRRVCEEYARRYPDIIHLMPEAPNKGLVDNYFDCLEAARGKYIADCAGDDYWCCSSKLATMTALLEKNKDATVVYSDTVAEWPDGRREYSYDTGKRPFCLPETLEVAGKEVLTAVLNSANVLPYVLSSALFRRESLKKVMEKSPEMVRNKNFGIEDVPVIAALASQGDALHFPEVTLVYVQQEESVSNTTSWAKTVKFYSRVLECVRQLALFYGVPFESIKENFDHKARYLAGCAFNSGDPELVSMVKATLQRWPLPLPFSARLNLAAFNFAPLRGLLGGIKKLLGRRKA